MEDTNNTSHLIPVFDSVVRMQRQRLLCDEKTVNIWEVFEFTLHTLRELR